MWRASNRPFWNDASVTEYEIASNSVTEVWSVALARSYRRPRSQSERAMRAVVAYLACLVVLFGLDMLWLTTMNGVLYQPAIGELLAARPSIPAIAVFYLLYVLGVVYFAIAPALANGALGEALVKGALFGFFCYATYDLTNLATLRLWSVPLSLVDIAWGTILTGTSAGAAFLVTRFVMR